MKKILITVIFVILVIGAFAVFMLTRGPAVGDEVVEDETNPKVQVGEEEYYGAEYPDGNDATTLGGLTFTLPEGYAGILSEDDSVVENLYIHTTTGTKLSVTKRDCGSEEACKTLGAEYLDGASQIKDFKVGGNEAHQYKTLIDGNVADCCFFIMKGDTMYTGTLWHPSPEETTADGEEPDPIPLTEEEIQSFDAFCESLALQ